MNQQFDIESPDYEVKVMNWIKSLPDEEENPDYIFKGLRFLMRSNGMNFSGLKLMLYTDRVVIIFKGMKKAYKYTELKELNENKLNYQLRAFIIDDKFWFYAETSNSIFGEFHFQEFGMDMTMPFLDKFNQ